MPPCQWQRGQNQSIYERRCCARLLPGVSCPLPKQRATAFRPLRERTLGEQARLAPKAQSYSDRQAVDAASTKRGAAVPRNRLLVAAQARITTATVEASAAKSAGNGFRQSGWRATRSIRQFPGRSDFGGNTVDLAARVIQHSYVYRGKDGRARCHCFRSRANGNRTDWVRSIRSANARAP